MGGTIRFAARSLILGLVLFSIGATVPAQEMGSESQRAEGKQLYDKFCAQCHGIAGDGQGYATPRTKPEPRDFTRGKYKFRTTPSGMLPTDDDIRKVIREGLPYTSMPAWPKDDWPGFTDQQVRNIIYHLKTFSPEFQNSESYAPSISISEPPASTDASIARGREVYEAQGCKACHGDLGRGDGLSAPTLKDDWGDHIRPADMTMPWTYRGGSSRKDIYRTFSTGLYGTPMPSYYDSVTEEDRWALVDYIYSLADEEPNYANLLLVAFADDELNLENADELFAGAPEARFPLVGQIMEPGRNFYPSATSIRVQAVYNRGEIAFRLRWNDMRAEIAGSNGPLLEVPAWDLDNPVEEGGGEEEESGFWGDAEEDAGEGDFWGDAAEEEGGDDFWGEDDDDQGAGADAGFSDAVAVQFPSKIPGGIAKPYFIFGDSENSVDLWFLDMARGDQLQQFVGRGSESLTPAATDEFEVVSGYDQGEWTVLIKRSLRSSGNIAFQQNQYVPVAFSVWDGFNRERGNKRALSAWMYLYVQPSETVTAVGPMVRIAVITLVIELLIILLLNRQFGRGREKQRAASRAVPQGS
jgi:mono/diheme cytochrome c family protein